MNSGDYKKASTYYLIGNIFNKGIAFLTVPVFTRILSTTDYGIVTTYNSWIGILAMVMGFALHMGVRMAFVDYQERIDEFMSSIILFTITCSFGIILIISTVVLLLKINVDLFLVVLCLFQAMSTAIIQDYTHYLMMRYKFRFRTALMILPNLIAVLLSIVAILFVFKTELYLGRIIPTALVHLVFGIIVVILVLRKGEFGIRKEYVKYALFISAPLIVHGIALNILSQSDRTMVTLFADASQTGVYSLIYNFSMIATVITTALEGVWIPWFTTKMQIRETIEINKIAIDYIKLMTCAMGCLILVAPEIVKLLAAKAYWEGIIIIPPVILSNYVIFIYTLYVNIEHFHKKTVYITFNTLIAALTNILLNLVFIPKYGYVAAAFTTLVSYVVSFMLHSRYARKLEPELYPIKTFVIPTLQLLILTIAFYCLIDYFVLRWGLMLLYFAGMLIYERKKILEFFPEIGRIFFKKGT